MRGASHGYQRRAGQQSGRWTREGSPLQTSRHGRGASEARRRSYTRGSEVGDRCRPSLKPTNQRRRGADTRLQTYCNVHAHASINDLGFLASRFTQGTSGAVQPHAWGRPPRNGVAAIWHRSIYSRRHPGWMGTAGALLFAGEPIVQECNRVPFKVQLDLSGYDRGRTGESGQSVRHRLQGYTFFHRNDVVALLLISRAIQSQSSVIQSPPLGGFVQSPVHHGQSDPTLHSTGRRYAPLSAVPARSERPISDERESLPRGVSLPHQSMLPLTPQVQVLPAGHASTTRSLKTTSYHT